MADGCETDTRDVRIALVTPAPPGSLHGNRATAARYARFLGELGHEVLLEETWSGEESAVQIALHARRSYPSIKRYANAYPEHPLVVVLTGTDLYRDIHFDESARESLDLASALIVLQALGPRELEPRHRRKTRVIYQSAEPLKRRPAKGYFGVAVIGHLRAEKDPFRAALAARLLPPTSRVRVTQAGRPFDEAFAEEARFHASENPRYRWLGEVPRPETRRLLSRSRLLAQTSLMEGGANTISEALAAGVPVIASDVPGNIGMLGEDYPGYYPVGDEDSLAQLLHRAETDTGFYALLEERCAARAYLVRPEREREALGRLVEDIGAAKGLG